MSPSRCRCGPGTIRCRAGVRDANSASAPSRVADAALGADVGAVRVAGWTSQSLPGGEARKRVRVPVPTEPAMQKHLNSIKKAPGRRYPSSRIVGFFTSLSSRKEFRVRPFFLRRGSPTSRTARIPLRASSQLPGGEPLIPAVRQSGSSAENSCFVELTASGGQLRKGGTPVPSTPMASLSAPCAIIRARPGEWGAVRRLPGGRK